MINSCTTIKTTISKDVKDNSIELKITTNNPKETEINSNIDLNIK